MVTANLLKIAIILVLTDVDGDLAFITRVNPIVPEMREEVTGFVFKEISEVKLVSTGLIRLYQLFISTQDVSACNFTQSCSRFGMEAFQKYGLFYGILMTSDRLQRCNSLARRYYPIDPKTGLAIDYSVEVYYMGKSVNTH